MTKQEKLVIIGNGPAGCTAALYAARADLAPLQFSGEVPGGLLTRTTVVENFPGFPEGVQGFDLVMQMQSQAERFGARLEYDSIAKAELSDGGKQLIHTGGGDVIEAEALIIATGADPRYLGLESEERLMNKGVSACATCDGAFFKGVPVAVAGGGDSAMEEATFLTNFASQVYLIHRRDAFRASPIMVEKARKNPKITFVLNSVVEEILGEEAVSGVRVRNKATGEVSELACKGFFAALGHVPSTQLFREQLTVDPQGYIVLDGTSSRTSLGGVFAAGDCADPHYRQAITAAGMGCRAAIDAERYLAK